MNAICKIGNLTLAAPITTAPMAGYTDQAFRILAREAGAALTYTEMISARGLICENKATRALLDLKGGKWPVAVQLFGREPDLLAEATRIAIDAGAAIVDLNMGCPTPKIVKNGEGAALMLDIPLAAAIVEAMVEAAGLVPVTVKMRKGWDEKSINVVEAAAAVAGAGAAAVTIHGRTRNQFYGGMADWDAIRQVKEKVPVTVIGNGDIRKKEDAIAMMEQTGCHGVMVGRGAIGNPWLISGIRAVMDGQPGNFEPDAAARIKMALRHLVLAAGLKGETVAVRQMRKHLVYYLRGLPGATRIRRRLNTLTTVDEIRDCLETYYLSLGDIITE